MGNGRYTDFGRRVYVFDLRKTIVVSAQNEADAENYAYSELYGMMLHDLEPGQDTLDLELTYMGRKVFDNERHANVFMYDEECRKHGLS